MRTIGKFLLRQVGNKLKSVLYGARAHPIIYNVNSAVESYKNRRALLVYLVRPFLLDQNEPEFLAHQNFKQCKQIAQLLGDFNYIVDAVDRHGFPHVRRRDYDLIIADRADLMGTQSFKKAALKIFLATSMNYAQHNRNIRRRHELAKERRNAEIQIRRVYPEAMPFLSHVNAMVGFGNEFIMSTWQQLSSVPRYPFNNYGFSETEFIVDGKDFAAARKNFLFFASRSQVQKGLDLLLEVFPKHPNLHLYVCSEFANEVDFCRCYHRELFETPNVHPVGWVTINTLEYKVLARKCAYVIHPTCSEGQPGSVVQCMYSGLIPVVTKWAGIDTGGFGITLDNDSLDELERTIVTVSELPEQWHKEQSRRTRRVAVSEYSEAAFVDRWRHILGDILDKIGEPSGQYVG